MLGRVQLRFAPDAPFRMSPSGDKRPRDNERCSAISPASPESHCTPSSPGARRTKKKGQTPAKRPHHTALWTRPDKERPNSTLEVKKSIQWQPYMTPGPGQVITGLHGRKNPGNHRGTKTEPLAPADRALKPQHERKEVGWGRRPVRVVWGGGLPGGGPSSPETFRKRGMGGKSFNFFAVANVGSLYPSLGLAICVMFLSLQGGVAGHGLLGQVRP